MAYQDWNSQVFRSFADNESIDSVDRFVKFEQVELLEGLGNECSTEFSESVALSMVEYPDISCTNRWIFCKDKFHLLTDPQLLAVHLIKRAHNEWFPISETRYLVRNGFLLGDGPGVGKTYTLAFTVAENLAAKEKWNEGIQATLQTGREKVTPKKFLKALWLTSSPQHFPKILEALRTMDNRLSKENTNFVMIYEFNGNKDFNSDTNLITDRHTILLMTYSTLIKEPTANQQTTRKRIDQIRQWMGTSNDFSGLLIFDESHFARGYLRSSSTHTCVVSLQEEYDRAKVIYSSATAAYDLSHFASMERLGIWGQMAGFENFLAFKTKMTKRGNACMEWQVLDLKKRGFFLSRQISWADVTVDTREVTLSNDDLQTQRMCSQMWRVLFDFMTANHKLILAIYAREANNRADSSTTPRLGLESQFFISQLRFEEAMLNSYKILEAVRLAYVYAMVKPPTRVEAEFKAYGIEDNHWDEWNQVEQVRDPHSVIIGMQMTGGGALYDDISKHRDKHGDSVPFGIPTHVLKTTFAALKIPVSESVVEAPSRILDSSDFEQIDQREQSSVLQDDLCLSDDDEDESDSGSTTSTSSSTSGTSDEVLCGGHVRGQKRPYEDQAGPSSPQNSSYDYWGVRKLVCQVAPPGSHGSYDNANRVPDESWDSLIETLTFKDDRTPEAFDQEATTMQKLFTILNARLPVNAMDRIVHLLGGKNQVAELSGRTAGVEYVIEKDEQGNKRLIQKPYSRGNTSTTNINECDIFQNELKQFALITDASSTGIDLHSQISKYCPKPRPRLHIHLEFAFCPAKNIQQMGRCHRTGQAHPPKIFILKTDLPSEVRFSAVIEERMESLGAACNGDCKSVSVVKGREEKYYTRLGDIAFTRLVRKLKATLKESGNSLLDLIGPAKIADNLVHIGLLKRKGTSFDEVALKVERCRYIQYLNRIMMLEKDEQENMIELLHEEIRILRRTNEAQKLQNSRGIFDVDPSTEIRCVTFAEEYHTCFGRSWQIQHFRRDRVARWTKHVSFAIEAHKAGFASEQQYDVYQASISLIQGTLNSLPVLELPLKPISNEFVSDYIFPYNRKKVRMTLKDFLETFSPNATPIILSVGHKEAYKAWEKAIGFFTDTTGLCAHVYLNGACPQKQPGTQINRCPLWGTKDMFLLSGDLMDIWDMIKSVTKEPLPKIVRTNYMDTTTSVMSPRTRVIVGVEFKMEHKASIKNHLSVFRKCKAAPWKWDVNETDPRKNLSLTQCPPILQRYWKKREQAIDEEGFKNSLFDESDSDEEQMDLTEINETAFRSLYQTAPKTQTPCPSSSGTQSKTADDGKSFLSEDSTSDDEI